MRNLLTRAVFDKTFKAGDKFTEPDLEMVDAIVSLRRQRRAIHFMDQETFETLTLGPDDRSATIALLLVGQRASCQIQKLQRQPDRPAVPAARGADGDLDRSPASRGDTASGGVDQARDARDRPRDPRAALHQGRREGQGPHRDARVRRAARNPSRGFAPRTPCTLSRAPLRRRAPFAWLTRCRSFAPQAGSSGPAPRTSESDRDLQRRHPTSRRV